MRIISLRCSERKYPVAAAWFFIPCADGDHVFIIVAL
jgi:hypothetical protein